MAPRMNVFFSAILVEDSSKNVNQMLCMVAFHGVTSVVAIGEKAALNSAKYGRNTGNDNMTSTNPPAGTSHQPSLISRGSAPLPPTTV